MARIAGDEYRHRDEELRWPMELLIGVGVGVLLVLVAVYLGKRRRRRPKTLAGRWAAHNGYVTRRDSKVQLFVQGPPFDRGDGVVQHALLVGSCAGRPSLITHFGWYHGDPGRVGGASVALVLELPGEVAPLQIDSLGGAGDDFAQAYRVTCDSPELVRAVVNPRVTRLLLAGPRHVNLRLDGTAMLVWTDGELTSPRQLETVHDLATELYRGIPRTVYTEPMHPEPARVQAPVGAQPVDVRGRAGEARQRDGEVSVSLPVDASWPRLTVMAYELMADQYRATTFDKPEPSAHPLVDIMFAVRSPDENFRRRVLDDLSDWLPIDERTRRCGVRLDRHGITAHAPGELTNPNLVALLTDVVYEVSQRLSADTYRHRPSKLPAG